MTISARQAFSLPLFLWEREISGGIFTHDCKEDDHETVGWYGDGVACRVRAGGVWVEGSGAGTDAWDLPPVRTGGSGDARSYIYGPPGAGAGVGG